MRILLVTSRPPELAGGVERFSLLLTRCLQAEGWTVDCITGLEMTRQRTMTAGLELALTWRLGRIASRLAPQYDLVISNGSWGAWISTYVPRVNAYHGTSAGGYRSLQRMSAKNRGGLLIRSWLERRSGADSYNVSCSEQAKAEIERYYRNPVHAVIEYMVDLDYYRPIDAGHRQKLRANQGIPRDAHLVLFVGRMEYLKGLGYFNAVAKRCQASLPRAWFLVVAPAIEPRWQHETVHYRVGANQEVVREAYQLSDVMLFPSHYESWGSVTMEALATGIPVIGGPTGATAALRQRDPELGWFVVDRWGEAEFYGKLAAHADLAQDRQQQLALRARKYAEKWAAEKRFREQWLGAMADACSGASSDSVAGSSS